MSPKLKPTVIIVDDDASIRRALRMQLKVTGFNVRVFASTEKFLAGKFPSTNACLLLDIYMPGIRGNELLEHLAATGRNVPAVLMSGRDDEETRKLARMAKGTPCLFKPFNESALLRAIRKALCRQSKHDR